MKNDKERNPGNLDRWLLTYADLITLLLGFFVVLYTVSQISAARYKSVTRALQGAFGHGRVAAVHTDAMIPPIRVTRQMLSDTLTNAIDFALLDQPELRSAVTLVPQLDGIALRFQDRILFDLGEAKVKPEAEKLLLSLAGVLSRFPNRLRIDGHTDDLPIHNAKFVSNWQLSTARAANVAHVLHEKGGIDGERITVTAHSEFQPAVPNTSDENRATNRRVEVVVLDE